MLEISYEVVSFIKHNHKKINHNKNKVIYLDDISKIKDWSKLLKGIEILIHTAAAVHLTKRRTSINVNYDKINCYASSNLMKGAINAGVKKFIYLGSL